MKDQSFAPVQRLILNHPRKFSTSDNGESADLAAALSRAGNGDVAAFEDVYFRTARKMFGICSTIFPNPHDAEDALQSAYATIWRKAGQFDPARASPITWMAVVTRNAAIDLRRAKGNGAHFPIEDASEIADDSPGACDRLIAIGDADELQAGIARLDPRDAGFIRDAFIHGATYAELARRSDLSLSMVKARIRRALLKLREYLGE